MEIASALSLFRTSSRGGSSQFPRIKEEGGPGGEEFDVELMFDVDADLEADNRAEPSLDALKRHSHRLRFLPSLAGAAAYIGEIDDRIDDTHLQHGLKRYPSAQI